VQYYGSVVCPGVSESYNGIADRIPTSSIPRLFGSPDIGIDVELPKLRKLVRVTGLY